MDNVRMCRRMVSWYRNNIVIRLDGGDMDGTYVLPYNYYRRKLRKEVIRSVFNTK